MTPLGIFIIFCFGCRLYFNTYIKWIVSGEFGWHMGLRMRDSRGSKMNWENPSQWRLSPSKRQFIAEAPQGFSSGHTLLGVWGHGLHSETTVSDFCLGILFPLVLSLHSNEKCFLSYHWSFLLKKHLPAEYLMLLSTYYVMTTWQIRFPHINWPPK